MKRVARISLAALLLLMAAGQSSSFDVFTAALGTYDVPVPTPALALSVIATEVLGGTGLLAPTGSRHRSRAATITLAVAAFWLVMAVQAFARGLVVPNCGCFGRYASQELRWWVLLEDVWFVASAAWLRLAGVPGFRYPSRDQNPGTLGTGRERSLRPEAGTARSSR